MSESNLHDQLETCRPLGSPVFSTSPDEMVGVSETVKSGLYPLILCAITQRDQVPDGIFGTAKMIALPQYTQATARNGDRVAGLSIELSAKGS